MSRLCSKKLEIKKLQESKKYFVIFRIVLKIIEKKKGFLLSYIVDFLQIFCL